jgi:hypothetical protein
MRRNSICFGNLIVDYLEEAANLSFMIGKDGTFERYDLSFLENSRFKSLTIDVFKDGSSMELIMHSLDLLVLAEGSAVASAIATCFPKENTTLVTEVSRLPKRVGGIMQLDDRVVVLRLSAFRGAIRTPLFQEELRKSLKLFWSEPDPKSY